MRLEHREQVLVEQLRTHRSWRVSESQSYDKTHTRGWKAQRQPHGSLVLLQPTGSNTRNTFSVTSDVSERTTKSGRPRLLAEDRDVKRFCKRRNDDIGGLATRMRGILACSANEGKADDATHRHPIYQVGVIVAHLRGTRLSHQAKYSRSHDLVPHLDVDHLLCETVGEVTVGALRMSRRALHSHQCLRCTFFHLFATSQAPHLFSRGTTQRKPKHRGERCSSSAHAPARRGRHRAWNGSSGKSPVGAGLAVACHSMKERLHGARRCAMCTRWIHIIVYS